MELENVTVQIIKHLEVQAGDTIVFSFPGKLSSNELVQFKYKFLDMFPKNIRCIVLEQGATCEGVLRLGQVEAEE